MLKNNSIALLIHLFIGVFMWLLSNFTTDVLMDNRIFNEGIMNVLLLFIPMLALLCYYTLGKFFLRRQSTNWKSLLSVSAVSIVGLVIWIFCAFFTSGGWAWIAYVVYNASFYFLMNLFPPANEWWIIVIPLLPTIMFWLAIKDKKKQ
ncbi:hypothetical protein [Bacillus luti]|uniref:hypothetical protein n=1 Tax=Bacillus luti TaxID=2026191 RepID=UPI003D0181E1